MDALITPCPTSHLAPPPPTGKMRRKMDRGTENDAPHPVSYLWSSSVLSPPLHASLLPATCWLWGLRASGTLLGTSYTKEGELEPWCFILCSPVVNDWLAYWGREDCYQHSLMRTVNTEQSLNENHEETFRFGGFPGLELLVQRKLARVSLLLLAVEEGGKTLVFNKF